MDRRITVVFVLLTFLILPSTASMEAGMNPSIFEEGCACHGEPSEGDDPLEIRHFLIQSDASTGGFIPGETYTGRIHVLGPGLNESNSNNTVFHLIATDGELNFGSAFQSHSDVMQNAIKHNDTWLSTNQSASHEWWDIEWTAPANITDYRPVNLTLYGMRANGDGVPNDADFWGISRQTIWTNPVWVYDYQQNNTNTSNNPGVNGIPVETQTFIRNHFLGPNPSTIGDGHPNWDCYEWGYWNWQELDASSESLGCPYYEALIANDAGDKTEPLSETDLEEFVRSSLEVFVDHGFWAVLFLGLLGCFAWYFSTKRLERFQEEDETILAARNSVYESIAMILFYGNFFYGAITFGILAMVGMGIEGGSDEMYVWIIISFVKINSDYGLIVCLISLFLFSAGCIKTGQIQEKISKLHYDARIKLIGGHHQSHIEPNEAQNEDDEEEDLSDEDLPLLRVLQAFLAAGLLLGGGDFFVRVILFAGFLKVSLRIWRFEPPQVTDDDIPEASDDTDQTKPDEERTEPVTFAEILEALDAQLKEAIEEAHDLREELEETKTKVITLEEEVQEKDVLIGEIEASKTTLTKEIDREEKEEREGKKLSLTDSVMVGDSIMGGMKVGSQVNNDPDAIARAVIAAYRAGREDKE